MKDRPGVAWWKAGNAPALGEGRDEARENLVADVSIEIEATGDALVRIRMRLHPAPTHHAALARPAQFLEPR